MKKLILCVSILSFCGLNVFGQCVPNSAYTQPGYYPDSLPHAMVGMAYDTAIQIKVLTDTMVGPFTGTVDSIVLNNINGLPNQFIYSCNPSSCHFPGGSNACINIYSTSDPTNGMIGSYPLKMYITVYGKLSGSPISLQDSVTSYNIHVDGPAGIPAIGNAPKFDLSQNYPDPAIKYTNIYYSLSSPSKVDFKMYNLLGKIVYQKSFYAEAGSGKITLDVQNFSPGIYMYNLSNSKATMIKRMVIAYN